MPAEFVFLYWGERHGFRFFPVPQSEKHSYSHNREKEIALRKGAGIFDHTEESQVLPKSPARLKSSIERSWQMNKKKL